MPAVLFLVYALAVARATKLINSDRITKAPRTWALKRLPEGSIWAYFVVCPWCVSIWLSVPAAPLTWYFGGLEVPGVSAWLPIPALALAYSAFTGYLAQFAEE
jgi:hypothetical protein